MDKLMSVVIPVYNEINITTGVERILGVIKRIGIDVEIILVDDGSEIGTWNEISDICRVHSNVIGIAFSRNFGKESAIYAGLETARGDCCVTIDCDMQHPPEIIEQMYRLWKEEGYEVIEGVKRERPKEGFVYKYSAKFFYKIIGMISGMSLGNSSDFILLDKVAVDALINMPEYSTFYRGLAAWIGFKRTAVEFDVAARTDGTSRWSTFKLAKLALDAATSFSVSPLYISAALGVVFLAVLIVVLAVCISTEQGIWDRMTMVILLQLMTGGILIISAGVMCVYLGKIYNEMKGRPRYIVRRMINKHKE